MRTHRLAAAAAAALASVATADDADPAAIRAARDAVFLRPEFRYGGQRARSFVEEWFDAYLEWLQEMQEAHPYLYQAAILGLAVLLVLLVAHIVWTLRAAREAEYEDTGGDAGADAAMRRIDPVPLRSRAVSHADAGRFDEAVRDLYTALVFTLDRRGALRWARHKALLDYRLEAARDGEARAALERFAGVYHPGSFGRRPPDRAHFDELLACLDGLAAAPR